MVKKLTPIKAIREYCYECSGWSLNERRNCEHTDCPLYPYRLGKRPKEKPEYTPVKAISRFCYECAGESYQERRLCPATECYLYRYRQGKNPELKGKRVNNISKYRNKQKNSS